MPSEDSTSARGGASGGRGQGAAPSPSRVLLASALAPRPAQPGSTAHPSVGSLHGLVGVQAGEADGAAFEGAQVDEHEGARRAEVWQGEDDA